MTTSTRPSAGADSAAPRRVHAVRVSPRATLTLAVVSTAALMAFAWPLLAAPDSSLAAHSTDAPWLFAALLPLLVLVVLAQISEGGMDAKAVAMLGVLSAVGAGLRPLGGGQTGFQPMFLVFVVGGRALGPGFGFVLGATSMFASALITGGVGPWLPFQMIGAAWVGLLAGLLPPMRGRAEIVMMAGYGLVSGLVYGLLLNLWGWPWVLGVETSISYVPGDAVAENVQRFWAYTLATSLGWDITRGIGTAVLFLLAGGPFLRAVRRASRRAAFGAPVVFEPAR